MNVNKEIRTDLKGTSREELEAFFAALGEPSYRAAQAMKWLYSRGTTDFQDMTDFSRTLRARLSETAFISSLSIKARLSTPSRDTEKLLLGLPDGLGVECVLMRYSDGPGKDRMAACISTQAGCSMGCAFCASGIGGVQRNLTTAEIVDQVVILSRLAAPQGERIGNVVLMGSGEPLANYRNSLSAIRLLNASEGMGIGMRHITISTCGLAPGIERLSREKLPLRLAVSLHATSDKLRDSLMPMNRKYPITALLDACRTYQEVTGRRITFEYVMILGVNDSIKEAHELGRLLSGIHSLVNLIPYNPIPEYPHSPSPPSRVREFHQIIETYGISATIRVERGRSIGAACGQLRQRDETHGLS
ncbi:MAG: 23S rRNA (adenine(2503)-C(2))-methyltransferase RlmN, partial [Armatimonadetes bacterium]|nr:23S rRNA (adenine(2503)-C(2))-methyltransferase RlmN [Armatimonadota bacterium]